MHELKCRVLSEQYPELFESFYTSHGEAHDAVKIFAEENNVRHIAYELKPWFTFENELYKAPEPFTPAPGSDFTDPAIAAAIAEIDPPAETEVKTAAVESND